MKTRKSISLAVTFFQVKEELKGYLKNTLETRKSVYTLVVYDSGGLERTFTEDLENNEMVKVCAKLLHGSTFPHL